MTNYEYHMNTNVYLEGPNVLTLVYMYISRFTTTWWSDSFSFKHADTYESNCTDALYYKNVFV